MTTTTEPVTASSKGGIWRDRLSDGVAYVRDMFAAALWALLVTAPVMAVFIIGIYFGLHRIGKRPSWWITQRVLDAHVRITVMWIVLAGAVLVGQWVRQHADKPRTVMPVEEPLMGAAASSGKTNPVSAMRMALGHQTLTLGDLTAQHLNKPILLDGQTGILTSTCHVRTGVTDVWVRDGKHADDPTFPSSRSTWPSTTPVEVFGVSDTPDDAPSEEGDQ